MAKKSYKKEAKQAAKRMKKAPIVVLVIFFVLLLIAVGVCFYLYKTDNPGFMKVYHQVTSYTGDYNGKYYEDGTPFTGKKEFDGKLYEVKDGLKTLYTGTYNDKVYKDGVDVTNLGVSDNDWDTQPYTHTNKQIPITGKDLSVHFLELGNGYTGDCTYIKAGDVDILVDAGSRANSIPTIQDYLNQYVTDNKLEYVIVTHADQDHIAGFAASESIFDLYTCDVIIDFAKTNKKLTTDNGGKTLYAKYLDNLAEEEKAGAKHYSVLECWNNQKGAQREYNLYTDGSYKINLEILYQEFYENKSTDENNYSVCFLLTETNGSAEKNYLFTGDLEKEGEESLVEENTLPKVELFKAGHHGSKTSSNDCLLDVIQPKIVCVCCCAGSVEYTQTNANTFPTQDFIDRVSKWTDKVYVTTRMNIAFDKTKGENGEYVNIGEYKLMNGNIVVMSNRVTITVECSHDNTILKDTAWFKNKRECPPNWQAVA